MPKTVKSVKQLAVTVISVLLAPFHKKNDIDTCRNGMMRHGKIQWKGLLKCSIMSCREFRCLGWGTTWCSWNWTCLMATDLPGNHWSVGDSGLPSSDQTLPYWLTCLVWPQIQLVITASSEGHCLVCWPRLLSWTCSVFLFGCCGTVLLSERVLPFPPWCDLWLPAPFSFPSSLPLLLPDIWLLAGEKMNCFLFIFIAEVGNKMLL